MTYSDNALLNKAPLRIVDESSFLLRLADAMVKFGLLRPLLTDAVSANVSAVTGMATGSVSRGSAATGISCFRSGDDQAFVVSTVTCR